MMKRLFTFLFALVAFSSLAQTQVRIINEAPGIDYEFKRCICNGKSAFIDMTITNNRSKDFTNVLKASVWLLTMMKEMYIKMETTVMVSIRLRRSLSAQTASTLTGVPARLWVSISRKI